MARNSRNIPSGQYVHRFHSTTLMCYMVPIQGPTPLPLSMKKSSGPSPFGHSNRHLKGYFKGSHGTPLTSILSQYLWKSWSKLQGRWTFLELLRSLSDPQLVRGAKKRISSECQKVALSCLCLKFSSPPPPVRLSQYLCPRAPNMNLLQILKASSCVRGSLTEFSTIAGSGGASPGVDSEHKILEEDEEELQKHQNMTSHL